MSESGGLEGEKARARERWNEHAESYHRWTAFHRRQYAPATELMLDLARIAPGSRVLDLAAGDGDQSLLAAARVGPTGYVLATDLAEDMLAIAEASAGEAGLNWVETRVMDAQELDLPDSSFDAVICRFGLSFFPNPDRALIEASRVLRSGGWISLATGAAGGSPQWSLALSVIRRRLGHDVSEPDPTAESPLGDPNVLRGKLESAAFADVGIHTVSVPLRLASQEDLKSYLTGWYPPARELLAQLPSDEGERILDETVESLEEFAAEGGYEIPNRVLVAAGRSD